MLRKGAMRSRRSRWSAGDGSAFAAARAFPLGAFARPRSATCGSVTRTSSSNLAQFSLSSCSFHGRSPSMWKSTKRVLLREPPHEVAEEPHLALARLRVPPVGLPSVAAHRLLFVRLARKEADLVA